MGQDKAGLLFCGHPLWRHQLATLASTKPNALFVAGKCASISTEDATIFTDEWPDCGPLGGLATALHRATAPWLLVLAVDMPSMSATFLTRLIAHAEKTGRGAVPTLDGQWEPLAAVYPKSARPLAEELCRSRRLAMRTFIEAAELDAIPVAKAERPLFLNVNTPADWRPSPDSTSPPPS